MAGGACQNPQGRCGIHTEDWHRRRELEAMRVEDDISCIAARGRCGVVPRSRNRSCEKPKGRCPIHAEEKDRCQSALDRNPEERCWNHRAEGSRFCGKHADYPDLSLTVQRWVARRRRNGVPLAEEDFMTCIRAAYPSASYPLQIHDFKKFVASFARPSAPSAARSRSRTIFAQIC